MKMSKVCLLTVVIGIFTGITLTSSPGWSEPTKEREVVIRKAPPRKTPVREVRIRKASTLKLAASPTQTHPVDRWLGVPFAHAQTEEKAEAPREVEIKPAPTPEKRTEPQREVEVKPAPTPEKRTEPQREVEVKPAPAPPTEAPIEERVALGPGVKEEREREEGIKVSPDQPQNTVSDIEIRGNQIISSGTILSKIKIARGDSLIQGTINEDIKRLYASGFFQDIKVDVVQESPGQFRVIFNVDEKPIVRQILFSGNTVFGENKLRKEILLIEGQIFDPKVVKEGIVKIREMYRNKGFKFADVKSEIDINPRTKEAVLYIMVDEGQKYRIGEIRFEGNETLSARKLRSLMRTKSRNLLFLRTGVYHEDHFQSDVEKLRMAYQQEGFADVRIEPRFEYDREQKKIQIVIRIEEGQRYHAGEVKIAGNVLFPESEIWEVLSMLPGDIYSQIDLNQDIQAIQRFYFYQGYVAAQVDPEIRFNRDTGKVDVLYTIRENDLFFVNKVKVRGNTKTKDMVVRRELRIHPGEKFDGQLIDRSKERLENLGYFQEVSFEMESPEDARDPNIKDLIFKVKEKQTGQLSFGGGLSSVESVLGFAEISQTNFDLFNWPTFTGGGQSISLKARIGTRTQNLDFSFTEPYIFNKPYSYRFSLYKTTYQPQNIPWEEERFGGSQSVGHAFTEYTSASLSFTIERVELDEIIPSVIEEVEKNGAENTLFKLGTAIAHDTRNNRFNPSRGHLLRFDPAFVFGDSDFYSISLSFAKYWTLFKTHVFESNFRIGTMDGLGGDNPSVPVSERYFAGGLGTVRGFGFRRIGPKILDEPIGGQSIVVLNLDYTFPIVRNFKGVIFLDIGQVTKGEFDFSADETAVSVGPGMKVNTPIGPMLFYYGLPVANADNQNKQGRFEFSIARAF